MKTTMIDVLQYLKAMLIHQFKQPSNESDEKFAKRAIRALEAVDGVDEHGHDIDVQQTALFKAIVTGLKDEITTHGHITKHWVGSAAKRIYGQVEAVVHTKETASS